MEAWQERVVVERDDLGEKIEKLNAFTGTTTFATLSQIEQGYLMAQLSGMVIYHEALKARIKWIS